MSQKTNKEKSTNTPKEVVNWVPITLMQPSIKIELYYEYSSIDRRHCFGIVTENLNNTEFIKNYIQWIWFHIGVNLQNKNTRIYPYKVGKLLYSYKFSNNAERQAKLIVNRINSYNLSARVKKLLKTIEKKQPCSNSTSQI